MYMRGGNKRQLGVTSGHDVLYRMVNVHRISVYLVHNDYQDGSAQEVVIAMAIYT